MLYNITKESFDNSTKQMTYYVNAGKLGTAPTYGKISYTIPQDVTSIQNIQFAVCATDNGPDDPASYGSLMDDKTVNFRRNYDTGPTVLSFSSGKLRIRRNTYSSKLLLGKNDEVKMPVPITGNKVTNPVEGANVKKGNAYITISGITNANMGIKTSGANKTPQSANGNNVMIVITYGTS